MKRNSVMRRLLAGAATLAVGMVGAVALATPAQATQDNEARLFGHSTPSSVHFIDNCDGTVVKLKGAKDVWDFKKWKFTLREYSIKVDGERFWPQDDDKQPRNGKWVEVFVPKDSGEIKVDYKSSKGKKWPKKHTWTEPDDCEQPVPPVIDADFKPLASCDLFIFIIRNSSEQAPVDFALIPNQDTVRGDAPALDDLIDTEDELVELPADTELINTQDVSADEVVEIGPLAPGEIRTHAFKAVEGLEVEVIIAAGNGEELLFADTLVWDTEGLDCEVPGEDEDKGEDGGEGGEEDEQLPVTGSSTMLIAAGALVLLALGGGLFMIARRRRVSFTA